MKKIHFKLLTVTFALFLVLGNTEINAKGDDGGTTMPCPNFCDNSEQQPLCCENPLGEKFFGVIIHDGGPSLPVTPTND